MLKETNLQKNFTNKRYERKYIYKNVQSYFCMLQTNSEISNEIYKIDKAIVNGFGLK